VPLLGHIRLDDQPSGEPTFRGAERRRRDGLGRTVETATPAEVPARSFDRAVRLHRHFLALVESRVTVCTDDCQGGESDGEPGKQLGRRGDELGVLGDARSRRVVGTHGGAAWNLTRFGAYQAHPHYRQGFYFLNRNSIHES